LFTFDLTADQGDEENFNLMRQGSVRLVLKFSQALAATVTVVVYADRLPNEPRLLVCNTDPSHRLGEHWVVIYVDDEGRYGEYFDSFGCDI